MAAVPLGTYPMTPNYKAGIAALNSHDDAQAVALLSREPADSLCWGLAQGDMAFALIALGRFCDAEAALVNAGRHFDSYGCPHPPSIVRYARALGEIRVEEGLYAEARSVFDHALNRVDELKKQHPSQGLEFEIERATLASSTATALMLWGRYDRALVAFQVATEMHAETGDRLGEAKAWMNTGHCAEATGDHEAAARAYKRALGLAGPLGISDFVARIRACLANVSADKERSRFRLFAEAVDQLLACKHWSQAYVQAAVWMQAAFDAGKIDDAFVALQRARAIEPSLSPTDHNRISMRTWAARLEDRRGNSDESLRLLLEGAHLWYERVALPVTDGDLVAITEGLHQHFRFLALALVKRNMAREALLSFETGRSLFHGLRSDKTFLERIRGFRPFGDTGNEIRLDLLQAAQDSIAADEAAVTFAALPPLLVAFFITHNNVVLLTTNIDDTAQLEQQLRELRGRFEHGDGLQSIPVQVLRIADEVQQALGTSKLIAIMPNGPLHEVPWRSLLFFTGVPWAQLPAAVEFGLLLRARGARVGLPLPRQSTAVGFGNADGLDLEEEARRFAAAFGTEGRFVPSASRQDVRDALASTSIVHISCHGVSAGAFSRSLELELRDGDALLHQLIGERVSPLVILSACESGVYEMMGDDYPVGAAPDLLRAGGRVCIGTRFTIGARFAAEFFPALARKLAGGQDVGSGLATVCDEACSLGADLWSDIGCVEMVRAP